MISYPEVIKYLDSFIDYEKSLAYSYNQSLRLERVKAFLTAIDNPQKGLACIHIAGTKGKGSTCAFIAYVLREAGYRVGLYTSP
ncbi:bifunctional folylpolyglutamate synthase/dihydrofolate synthase, partial [Candidatus Omnitrophota bacterium]